MLSSPHRVFTVVWLARMIQYVSYRAAATSQDVNGGALQVQDGATVHFSGTSGCYGVEITSDNGDNDFTDHDVFGGYWYNEVCARLTNWRPLRKAVNRSGIS